MSLTAPSQRAAPGGVVVQADTGELAAAAEEDGPLVGEFAGELEADAGGVEGERFADLPVDDDQGGKPTLSSRRVMKPPPPGRAEVVAESVAQAGHGGTGDRVADVGVVGPSASTEPRPMSRADRRSRCPGAGPSLVGVVEGAVVEIDAVRAEVVEVVVGDAAEEPRVRRAVGALMGPEKSAEIGADDRDRLTSSSRSERKVKVGCVSSVSDQVSAPGWGGGLHRFGGSWARRTARRCRSGGQRGGTRAISLVAVFMSGRGSGWIGEFFAGCSDSGSLIWAVPWSCRGVFGAGRGWMQDVGNAVSVRGRPGNGTR